MDAIEDGHVPDLALCVAAVLAQYDPELAGVVRAFGEQRAAGVEVPRRARR
jgi:hypothetical protein